MVMSVHAAAMTFPMLANLLLAMAAVVMIAAAWTAVAQAVARVPTADVVIVVKATGPLPGPGPVSAVAVAAVRALQQEATIEEETRLLTLAMQVALLVVELVLVRLVVLVTRVAELAARVAVLEVELVAVLVVVLVTPVADLAVPGSTTKRIGLLPGRR